MVRRKPYVTYFFLAVNILVYGYMLLRYGTTQSSEALLLTGANYTPLIVLENEWWRLISAAFIHIGFTHILMNGISLFYLGQDLEQFMGHGRFAFIYLVSAIGGNLFSYAFSSNTVSAGASTAIFGLFAAYVALGRLYSHVPILQQRAASYTVLIAINFINGILSGGVDNWGHLGGAVYGLVITIAIGLPNYHRLTGRQRFLALLVLLILSGVLVFIGIQKVHLAFGL